MPTPATQLGPWLAPQEETTLSVGVDGLALLIPGSEPLSAGAVPINPDLIDGLSSSLPSRRVRSRAGYDQTSPAETKQRPEVRVSWTGLTRAQRDTLMTFLRVDCKGGELAFSAKVDGSDAATSRAFRMLEDPADEWVARDKSADGVYVVTVRCEQVFSA